MNVITNKGLSSLYNVRYLNINTEIVSKSMQRLSTGSRINSAMDDAAGSAISLHLSNRISGSDIAQNNIQTASSMLNVALGALDNISNMFLRLRDLSLQAMNDTYSDEERKVLQDEAESLVNEIYRVKSSTKFNSKQILGVDSITSESDAIAQGYTVVKTAQQLKDALKTNDSDCKVMLFSDINLDDLELDETGSNWTAVGTTSSRFKGTFDGNGFSISNLKINRPDENYQGFFGATDSSTIKNVSIENAEVKGNKYTGGLVGCNHTNSTIENCTSSGIITVNSTYAGGIAGANVGSSIIKNCTSDVIITGNGKYTGGLVGENYGNSKIQNCSASGKTIGQKNYTGGLVGNNSNYSTIQNCSSSATVTGNGDNIGGLVGNNSNYSTIQNCSSSATVTGNSYTGGLVGISQNESIINNCSSSATVTGNGDNIGGLAGRNISSTIGNCTSSATVTGNNYTGGLVGTSNNNSTIENCMSAASVTGNNYTGGIVGQNHANSKINSSSSSATVKGNSYVGGLVGDNYNSTVEYCSSSANVLGSGSRIGGIAGQNYGSTIQNCVSSSNVTGSSNTGGLVGYNSNSIIQDCNTTSVVEGGTYTGALLGLYSSGELSDNEYNSAINEGMRAVGGGLGSPTEAQIKDNQDLVIEENSIDLSGIGANLDLKKIGANIDNIVNTGNSGSSTNTKATIQVGYDAGVDNTIDVDTGFYLGKFNINISTEFGAKKALDRIDEVMTKILDKKSELGAKLNRLDNAMYNQKVSKTDLMSQNSLIKDTDVAKESCNLVQHQILQEISTSLFTVNRQSPNIALKLLNLA